MSPPDLSRLLREKEFVKNVNSERVSPLVSHRHEFNIRKGCYNTIQDMKLTHLAQNRVKRLAKVGMLLELTVQKDTGNILTSWLTTFLPINHATWIQEYEKRQEPSRRGVNVAFCRQFTNRSYLKHTNCAVNKPTLNIRENAWNVRYSSSLNTPHLSLGF